ncbi:MAG: TRAP-type C4-dicarboxylate transport system, large permease component [Firmicutes bacterium]|nr:TRAP-type C4-dicarboxylate transport system, large permease component [Bacillota bacterium]
MYLVGIFILTFIVLAILRIPIPFSIGLAGIVGLIVGDIPLSIIPAKIFGSVDSFAFLAIPAFIYSGDLMALGGITTALIKWIKALTGRLKGSVAATTVIASALFGTISGSSVATVSAIGGMMLPEMVKSGYKKEYATALIAASGFLGILIPPSIPGVVYALASGQSISDVWLSTAVPGVLLTILYVIYNRIFFAKQEVQDTGDFNASIYFKNIAKTSSRGLVALLMPLIIFAGVYGGVLTPTEAGAVAVVYGLIAGWIIFPVLFKDKTGEGFMDITKKSVVTSAAIMLLIAFSAIPSGMFTYGGCAKAVTDWLFSVTNSPTMFLLMVNAMLIIVGMFMETNTSILLLAPILVPAAVAYGINPIHFGAVMLLNLEIGMITPPFACNIFVACRIANLSMEKMLKYILGFIAVCIPVLLATTYIPQLSLVLVNLFK